MSDKEPLYQSLGFRIGMMHVRGWADFFTRFCVLVYMAFLAMIAIGVLVFCLGSILGSAAKSHQEDKVRVEEIKQLRLDVDALRGVDTCPP
jgi:hypothetical protein